MPVTKPTDVPRWADGGTDTPTNVVDPPEHTGSIPAWAPGPYTVAQFVGRAGNYYIVTAIAGTGTSTTGPTGTGQTIDNPGANQVVWQFVTTTPVTKDSGWLPGIQPPAQFFNWLFFLIYQWILWLQDIANQDFRGTGVGPWTAPHEFTGGTVAGPNPAAITAQPASSDGAVAIRAFGGTNTGGGPGGDGVVTTGGASSAGGGNGIRAFGNGAGNGGVFTGGSTTTSGGDGVEGIGGDSGAGGAFLGGNVPSGGGSGGPGIRATGGPGREGAALNGGTTGDNPGAICTANANGIGVAGISPGTGAGVAGTSFGTGPGVQGIASTGAAGILGQSSGAQPAGQFDNTGGSSGGHGIQCSTNAPGSCAITCTHGAGGFALLVGTGNMKFTGASPGGDPGTYDTQCGNSIIKACGSIVIKSDTDAEVLFGFNITVAMIDAHTLRVTMYQGVNASSAYGTFAYKVTHNIQGVPYYSEVFNKTNTTFDVVFRAYAGGALMDFTGGGFFWNFDFDVQGRHL